MRTSYVIYGAGGHATVVADLIKLQGGKVEAFFNDQLKDDKSALVRPYEEILHSESRLIIGIGNNVVREKIAGRVKHKFGTLIHPSAYVAEDVELGEGTVILANAVVQSKACIGKHVIINAGVCVDHDAVINDFVLVYPNAYIGGGSILEKGVLINPGAIILRNVVVKEGSEIPPLSVVK
ncbi:PglD-related sugar-binding protein [Adhaeribacter pallidiroseus]|uniref:Putative acetyltransferase EpsM n=1 Tax=Adhaeribacter pallidiroseus TaxID=2072847 RepID=A0A369QS17_9BACT|nr:transferase [Adhaeribacter pallidiroseus]RDC66027.1 putative acetyltransferase EpsM [Adhaeribacter pallidiroseus]